MDGGLGGIIVGLGDGKDLWAGGRLSRALPAGHYRLQELIGIEEDDRPTVATWLALAWILGAYRFERYKTEPDPAPATLVWPETADRAYVQGAALAAILTRDLINTPAEDMGPDALVAAAEDLAVAYGATFNTIVGDELLAENFPAIHAVGRAAAKAPCLIDLTWGKPDAPKVTLVGKGVCFRQWRFGHQTVQRHAPHEKDMGGAATVLGLADWIMRAALPVCLRVLIPAVENAISGNAFRPGDIVATRKGPTIEVGNTDAEGGWCLPMPWPWPVRTNPISWSIVPH